MKWLRIALILTCAVASRAARAETTHPGLIDHGSVFQPDTAAKVNGIAAQIQQTCHYDLVIEAFDSIPSDRLPPGAQPSNAFYTHWLLDLAQREQVRGVFVLVVKHPGHLQIGVGAVTGRKAFTGGDRIQLTDQLLAAFRAQQFDAGLVNAADFVQQTMMRNLGVSAPPDAAAQPMTPSPAQEQSDTTHPATAPASEGLATPPMPMSAPPLPQTPQAPQPQPTGVGSPAQQPAVPDLPAPPAVSSPAPAPSPVSPPAGDTTPTSGPSAASDSPAVAPTTTPTGS